MQEHEAAQRTQASGYPIWPLLPCGFTTAEDSAPSVGRFGSRAGSNRGQDDRVSGRALRSGLIQLPPPLSQKADDGLRRDALSHWQRQAT